MSWREEKFQGQGPTETETVASYENTLTSKHHHQFSQDEKSLVKNHFSQLRGSREVVYRRVIDEFLDKILNTGGAHDDNSLSGAIAAKLANEPANWSAILGDSDNYVLRTNASWIYILFAEAMAKFSYYSPSKNSAVIFDLINSLAKYLHAEHPFEKPKLKLVLAKSHIICDVLHQSVDQSGKFLDVTDPKTRSLMDLLDSSTAELNDMFASIELIPERVADYLFRIYSKSSTNHAFAVNWFIKAVTDKTNKTQPFSGALASRFFIHSIHSTMDFNEPELFERLFKLFYDSESEEIMNLNFFNHDNEMRKRVLREIFQRYLKLFRDDPDHLETLYRIWSHVKYVPPIDLAKQINQLIKAKPERGWVLKQVTISDDGKCVQTGAQLEKRRFDREKLDQMAREYRDKILIRSELNKVLVAKTLHRYDQILRSKQFAVICDGMSSLPRMVKSANCFDKLEYHWKLLKDRYDGEVLVFVSSHLIPSEFRRHLSRFRDLPGLTLFDMNSTSSGVSSSSLMVYGALRCGPGGAKIFTNNLLYNTLHKFDLSYLEWLKSVHIQINPEDPRSLSFPTVYHAIVQKKGDRWYLPYSHGSSEWSRKWVCIYKKSPLN